jgi:hypothetical protein
MSRLDSVIRRLKAQRACLGEAARRLADLPAEALVFEVGLGNGRTYDHLREILPGREIYVFDRQVNAHPDCIPDEAHLFLGDIFDTLPRALSRFEGKAGLVHADVGSGDEAANRELALALREELARLLMPGGLLVSDQEMAFSGSQAVALPEGVAPGRYNIRRKDG